MFVSNDEIPKGGAFFKAEEIFSKVPEEEIFSLAFTNPIVLYEKITSPLRKDSNPSCFFKTDNKGYLTFVDYGATNYPVYLDCINFAKFYFNTNSYAETLQTIYDVFVKGKERPKILKEKKEVPISSKKEIFIQTRPFNVKDKRFWSVYGISSQNLIEDKVFAISSYMMTNTKVGTIHIPTYDISYAYTDFRTNNIKIYRPYNKSNKFITNCVNNDIYGKDTIKETKKLVITKSYKDYRVLKNFGINVIGLQSETMYPSIDILLPIINRYDVFVFFDRDSVGIEAGLKFTNYINSFGLNKAKQIYLPFIGTKIKDPSDLYKYQKDTLIGFLKENKLLE
jgi:hypothetical protein